MIRSIYILLALAVFIPTQFAWGAYSLELKPIDKSILQEVLIDAQETTESFYTLHHRTHYHITDDSVIETVSRIDRFSSADDLQEFGQDSISFNEHTEFLTITGAAAISASGQVTPITKADLKVIDNNSYDIFSSRKELLVNYLGMQKDGFIYLTFHRKIDRTKLESDWLESSLPQTSVPRKGYSLTAEWANQKPNISIHSPWVKCQETESSLTCEGHNIPSIQQDDRWHWRDEAGFIQIGESNSWQVIQQRVKKYFDNAQGQKTQSWLTQILDGTEKSIEQKIEKIHAFVARDIRYLSRSEYGHAVTPHATSATFQSRQGDCKDKSALLIELLAGIGLKPYPVLVHTNKRQVTEQVVPSLNQFNHVIVCFDHLEKEYCIDATDKHTPWQYLSEWIQGAFALRALNTSSQPFALPKPTYTWERSITSELVFLDDGGQKEIQTRTFVGHYAAWLKSYLNSTEAKDVNAWLLESYQSSVTDLGEPEFSYDGYRAMATDVVIHSKVTLDPFLDTAKDLDYQEAHAWMKKELSDLKLKNDHYAEHFPGIKISETVNLDFNNLWELAVPPSALNLVHKYGSLRRVVDEKHNGKLSLTVDLEIPSRLIPIDEKEQFNDFLDVLYKNLNFMLYSYTKKAK